MTITVLLFAALLAVVTSSALLMIAAENSSLKPRKARAVVVPIRFLYVAIGILLALLGTFGVFLCPPLGIAAALSLVLAGCFTVQSWREAKAVRENERFDGYEWWRGGVIMRFGNKWAAGQALAALRAARAQVDRHRAAESSST